MTPYASLKYFAYLLLLVVPAMVLGLLGRPVRKWFSVATLLAIILIYSDFLKGYHTYWFVMLFFLGEWVLVQTYSYVLRRLNATTDSLARGAAETAIAGPRPIVLTPELLAKGYQIPLREAQALHLLAEKLGGRDRRAEHLVAARLAWAYRAALALSLLPLLLVKFYPLIRHSHLGFLGISYLTFRCVQVIIELNDGLIKKVGFRDYFSYILAFPTLTSGPIDRFRRFVAELNQPLAASEYLEYLSHGVHCVFRGFLYKFIVAFAVKQYWLDPVSTQPATLFSTVSYMYAYSLYLFFDFAGYSAFAVGISSLFGLRVPENFRQPFASNSIKDFWNRWHISLSSWFRDFIYMRFLLNTTKKQLFRDKYTASTLGYLLTFGLMGLWHGFESRFILYGLYHAVLMVGYEAFERWNRRTHVWGNTRGWQVASIIITVQSVCFGFLIFSGRLV